MQITLEELENLLKKKRKKGAGGFQIVDWFIRDEEVRFECYIGFRRPLMIIIYCDMEFIEI